MTNYLLFKESRSVEDIYIDDDFCQGISQNLAANMELLSGPEYENIDYELVLAEILHTQEHLFGNTLTDGEQIRLQTCESDDNVFDDNNKLLPICDAVKQSIDNENGNNDEPKVEETQ